MALSEYSGCDTYVPCYGASNSTEAPLFGGGIFITTSGFTNQAREFARSLPLELIDGERLRMLLAEHPPSL
jgi:restriction endonuclease Mrr